MRIFVTRVIFTCIFQHAHEKMKKVLFEGDLINLICFLSIKKNCSNFLKKQTVKCENMK